MRCYAHDTWDSAGASLPMVMLVIADDEPRLRLLLRTLLRGEGHDVREAADGEAALREIRARPPAVAILDVQMPGLSGLEVCRRVRADPRLAAVRLLVVSADATEADARAAGADAFLAKPFSPARLLATVADLAPAIPAPPPPAAPRPLRELRAERLLAIRDLARAAGLAVTTIYEIEAGLRRAGPRARRRIAAALGVDPDDVAELDTAGPPPGTPDPREAADRLEAMGYPRTLARRVFGLPPD